jgi:hypothetical protein
VGGTPGRFAGWSGVVDVLRKDPARFSLRKGSSGRVEWPAAPKLFSKELGNAAGRQTACEVWQLAAQWSEL